MESYLEVIVDVAHSNVDRVYDYLLPEGVRAPVGCRVRVPFAGREVEAFVIRHKDSTDCAKEKLKRVTAVIDEEAIFTQEQLQLAQYIKREYRTTLAFALRFMFPADMRGGRVSDKRRRMVALCKTDCVEKEIARCYAKNGAVKAKNKLRALQMLREGPAPSTALPSGIVPALIAQGIARDYYEEAFRTPYLAISEDKEDDLSLTEEQKSAVQRIDAFVDAGKKQTILLHGVTGSGKTEVYIRTIEHALAQNRTAIMLVPEISLTPQLFARFSAHFPGKVAVFHSGLSAGERYDEWKRVKCGQAKIVLGARSAVFMPLENLGLLIIDEEHEPSYKADNHPPYHAADIARMRAALCGAVLVLASATPRMESYMKAQLGIYQFISMPQRVRGLALPEIQIVDMRREFLSGNQSAISGTLYQAVKEVLQKGEQALLFLNRRGYAASVQCAACGHVMMCTHCDVPLKYHRVNHALTCHYCGRTFPFSTSCPKCGQLFIRLLGMGTEQVERQIAKLFPDARILRMDFDTTRAKDAHMKIYTAFKNHEADILIGTQMIARGLDFQDVTLAAIISADTMLTSGDFRAEERTFSMIEQVGGRAGRSKEGRVIVQTSNPAHYAIRYAARHDYAGMYAREMAHRRATAKPPYARLFRMVFAHENAERARRACAEMEEDILPLIARFKSDILLFAAKAAPVEKLDGRARFHILLKVVCNKNTKEIKEALFDMWETHSKRGVPISIDIDPSDVN